VERTKSPVVRSLRSQLNIRADDINDIGLADYFIYDTLRNAHFYPFLMKCPAAEPGLNCLIFKRKNLIFFLSLVLLFLLRFNLLYGTVGIKALTLNNRLNSTLCISYKRICRGS